MEILFHDIHAHVYKYQYPAEVGKSLFINMEQLMDIHDKLGIKKAVLLPIVSPEVYVPQSVGEIIDYANQSGGRFIPFCNIDPRVLTNTSDAPLGHLLEYYKSLHCQGIGEVMPNLSFDDKRMQNLFYHVEKTGFPLLFDLTGKKDTGYGLYDEPSLPMLERCLEQYSTLKFIGHGPAFWAEIAALQKTEDRLGYPSYEVHEEGVVPKLLRKYPNLHVDLSAYSGFNALHRDKEYACHFLNEFSDRIFFGSDLCYLHQPFHTADLLKSFRNSGKISHQVFAEIAHANFDRLFTL